MGLQEKGWWIVGGRVMDWTHLALWLRILTCFMLCCTC